MTAQFGSDEFDFGAFGGDELIQKQELTVQPVYLKLDYANEYWYRTRTDSTSYSQEALDFFAKQDKITSLPIDTVSFWLDETLLATGELPRWFILAPQAKKLQPSYQARRIRSELGSKLLYLSNKSEEMGLGTYDYHSAYAVHTNITTGKTTDLCEELREFFWMNRMS